MLKGIQNKILNKRLLFLVITTLLLFSVSASTYYFLYYSAPEKCYFEKMGAWLSNENYSSTARVPFKDHLTKIAVQYKLFGPNNVSSEFLNVRSSEAKAILSEYKLTDLPNNFSENSFIQMKASYDYCDL